MLNFHNASNILLVSCLYFTGIFHHFGNHIWSEWPIHDGNEFLPRTVLVERRECSLQSLSLSPSLKPNVSDDKIQFELKTALLQPPLCLPLIPSHAVKPPRELMRWQPIIIQTAFCLAWLQWHAEISKMGLHHPTQASTEFLFFRPFLRLYFSDYYHHLLFHGLCSLPISTSRLSRSKRSLCYHLIVSYTQRNKGCNVFF